MTFVMTVYTLPFPALFFLTRKKWNAASKKSSAFTSKYTAYRSKYPDAGEIACCHSSRAVSQIASSNKTVVEFAEFWPDLFR